MELNTAPLRNKDIFISLINGKTLAGDSFLRSRVFMVVFFICRIAPLNFKIRNLMTRCIWYIWDKVFKNGPSKICGRQPLKYLKGVWSA